MNEDQGFLYKTQNLSYMTNNQSEISSVNELKYNNKDKLTKKLIKLTTEKEKTKIQPINSNNLDENNNNLNYFKTQNKDEIINKEEINHNIDINKYQNILNKKNKNLNKNRKNKLISNLDSVNENLVYDNFSKPKDLSEKYDFNRSDRKLKDEEEKVNNKKSLEEQKLEDKELIEKLYEKIIGYNIIGLKILYKDLYKFFFSPIPKDKTLSTNINIRNNIVKDKINSNIVENKKISENIEKIKTYDFDLEILRNQQIYFFAKILKSLPSLVIKIYISDNFYKCEGVTQKNIFESDFYLVGKIESNIWRIEFNIYKLNNENNYSKILSINYSINIFGLFGVREMIVNKYENNSLLYTLKNQIPKWDNEFKVYKLNFNGRVKLTCKKNFILQKENENILQCGKIDDNSFALDFISPLSPFESFCISITSLVNKKACE